MKFGFISFLKEERRKEIEKIFMIFYFRKRRRNVDSSLYISYIYHQFFNTYFHVREFQFLWKFSFFLFFSNYINEIYTIRR